MIAVVAKTKERADALVRELNIARAIPFGVQSVLAGGGRGLQLEAVLVDDTALPLDERVRATLEPAMYSTGGRFYELCRGAAETSEHHEQFSVEVPGRGFIGWDGAVVVAGDKVSPCQTAEAAEQLADDTRVHYERMGAPEIAATLRVVRRGVTTLREPWSPVE